MGLVVGNVVLLNKAGSVPPTPAPTTTALTALPNPAVAGTTVTLTATVTSTTAGTITGMVTFFDGATSIGTGNVGGGVATLQTSTLSVRLPAHGEDTAGEIEFRHVHLDLRFARHTTHHESRHYHGAHPMPNPAVAGAVVTLTATVTSTTAATITGTVTFLDGASSLGTGSVGAGGVTTLQISTLSVATHSITTMYGGDSNFADPLRTPFRL